MPSGEPLIFDCVVVGCGPAGLISALALSEFLRETDCTIALIGPSLTGDDERTTALLDSTLTSLEALSLRDDLAELGTPLKTMQIIDATGHVLQAPPATFHCEEIDLPCFGVNIANKELNALLSRAVQQQNNLTCLDTTVTKAEQISDLWPSSSHPLSLLLSLNNGQSLRTRCVLAADGQNSPMRQHAGISVRQWKTGQSALVTKLRHTRPHHHTSLEIHARTGPFTLVPFHGQVSSLVYMLDQEGANKLKCYDEQKLARALEEVCQSCLGTFTIEGPVQFWPVVTQLAKRYAKNRVYLIGEAAHSFPPLGAQGLNLGVRDALYAAQKVAEALTSDQDPGSDALMQDYHRQRRKDIALRTGIVHGLNLSLIHQNTALQALRSTGLGLAAKLPFVRRQMMHLGMGPAVY
jgi:2-octaprenyl-6-methoxyphenol hydroxylase